MTPRPTTWRRRIQRPWISAVLLAPLLLDAWWVTRISRYSHASTAAFLLLDFQEAVTMSDDDRRLSRMLRSAAAENETQPPHLSRGRGTYLIRETQLASSPLRLVHEDSASWDELSRLLAESPERVAVVNQRFADRHTGLWALTRESRFDTVSLKAWEPGAFDDVPVDGVRALLHAQGWPGAPSGPADQSTTRILPLGYLHNTAALLTLAAFIISLGWIPRLPAAYRARRGRLRLARGYCPRCRYHLAGLEADQCPECGERWGG